MGTSAPSLRRPHDERQAAALLDYLQSFLTPRKRERFDQVLLGRTRYFTVVLEELHHAHNTSAVLRSCDAFGVQDIYIVEQENEFCVSQDIALGAEQWLTLHPYGRAEDCLQTLRGSSYQIVATVPEESAIPVSELDLSRPTALIFGREKTGVSEFVRQQADALVTVPMTGFVESFNVSVAAGIILYELTSRLHEEISGWQLSETEQAALRLEWTRCAVPNVAAIERRFWEDCDLPTDA